jgi:hypothetical protein
MKFLKDLFDKHAADIGRIAIAWNGLHVALGESFSLIVSPDSRGLATVAWEAVSSDRSKRAMLEAAAREKFRDDSRWVQELRWALGQINALEDRRNDVIHTPFSITLDEGVFKFAALDFSKNPRALKLKNKDLAVEFRSYHENIGALTQFCLLLRRLIDVPKPSHMWPERPALPRPAQVMASRRLKSAAPHKAGHGEKA